MSGAPPAIAPGSGGLALVIPCYRESKRLPRFLPGLCDELAKSGLPGLNILVVDDGSGGHEASLLEEHVLEVQSAHPFLLDPLLLPENVGKGGTVYAGWNHLAPSARCLAFVDADGAVPPRSCRRFLETASALPPHTALFASRLGGGHVHRSPARRFAGWGFRTLVRLLFALPVGDTQCGLKMIPTASWLAVRDSLQRTDFLFDIELATALLYHGDRIESLPVDWDEKPGSHLGPVEAARMGWALLTLRASLPRPPVRG